MCFSFRWTPLVYLFLALLVVAAAPARSQGIPGYGLGSNPELMPPAVGERALFRARPAFASTACLGTTDGTPGGTTVFADCTTLTGGFFIVSYDDRKYFTAVGEHGPQVWVSDGTATGTRPITSFSGFNPVDDFDAEFPGGLLAVFGDDGVHGREIWLSDGTPEGTRMLVDLMPGEEGSLAYGLHFHQGSLYFAGGTETPQQLWRSELTAATTAPFFTLPDGHRVADRLWAPAERLVFSTFDEECRQRIWSSDGSAAGTGVLAEFATGCPGAIRRIVYRTPTMYFLLDDGVHGVEVWATDGVSLRRLTDLPAPDPFPRRFFIPLDLAGGLTFIADGGPDVGVELWRTDGTPAGTRLVKDICPGPCSGLDEVTFPTFAGGRAYFAANDGTHGWEVWVTDGTSPGTRLVADLCPGDCPDRRTTSVFAPSDDRDFMLVTAEDGAEGGELWRLQPEDGSVVRLTDFAPQHPFSHTAMVDLPPGVVFAADDGVHGSELWITDGTVADTRLLVNLTADREPPSAPPARPTDLQGRATFHGGVVELTWAAGQVGGTTETWTVEARSPAFDWTVVAQPGVVSDPALGWVRLTLEDDTPYTFRVRGENSAGVSPWSEEASLTTLASFEEDPCLVGDHLCLADGRFLVQVEWRNQHAAPGTARQGVGRAIPGAGSDRSGFLWFFKPDNVELVVKVLDGTTINGFHWTFYGALTNVEYWITVTDLTTLDRRTYHNPPGEICGRGDTSSLPADSAALLSAAPGTAPAAHRVLALDVEPHPPVATAAAAHPVQPCVEDATTLCLLDGRFRVRVSWDDHHNHRQGVGGAVPFSERAGFFWFFNPQNIELVVKVLDGRSVNGKIWVFYGALSNVGYTIDVSDLQDGHAVRSYENTPGNICGDADTAAF